MFGATFRSALSDDFGFTFLVCVFGFHEDILELFALYVLLVVNQERLERATDCTDDFSRLVHDGNRVRNCCCHGCDR
jgi:hypothetical protein